MPIAAGGKGSSACRGKMGCACPKYKSSNPWLNCSFSFALAATLSSHTLLVSALATMGCGVGGNFAHREANFALRIQLVISRQMKKGNGWMCRKWEVALSKMVEDSKIGKGENENCSVQK